MPIVVKVMVQLVLSDDTFICTNLPLYHVKHIKHNSIAEHSLLTQRLNRPTYNHAEVKLIIL
jgi:hypothetical protein